MEITAYPTLSGWYAVSYALFYDLKIIWFRKSCKEDIQVLTFPKLKTLEKLFFKTTPIAGKGVLFPVA